MGVTTLMSTSDGLDPYFFRRKKEKTRFMKEEMDGELFVTRQSWHFFFLDTMIKVLSRTCTLNRRVNFYVSRQENYTNRRNDSSIFII